MEHIGQFFLAIGAFLLAIPAFCDSLLSLINYGVSCVFNWFKKSCLKIITRLHLRSFMPHALHSEIEGAEATLFPAANFLSRNPSRYTFIISVKDDNSAIIRSESYDINEVSGIIAISSSDGHTSTISIHSRDNQQQFMMSIFLIQFAIFFKRSPTYDWPLYWRNRIGDHFRHKHGYYLLEALNK